MGRILFTCFFSTNGSVFENRRRIEKRPWSFEKNHEFIQETHRLAKKRQKWLKQSSFPITV